MIRRYLIENNHKSILIATPQAGLGKKSETRDRTKLNKLKKSLDAEEVNKLIEETRRLQKLQLQPDTPEALATLPSLELKDVPEAMDQYPLEIKKSGGKSILFHDLFTNHIAYTQIGFNTQTVSQEMIQYIPLMGSLVLGMVFI